MTRGKRILVETRDGGLFAGQVQIFTSDAECHLERKTAVALRFETYNDWSSYAHHFRGSYHYYRLHQCRICGQRFIAHHAARVCSSNCAVQVYHLTLEGAKNERAERRASKRARYPRFQIQQKGARPDVKYALRYSFLNAQLVGFAAIAAANERTGNQ